MNDVMRSILKNQQTILAAFIAALAIILGVTTDGFFTVSNLKDILLSISFVVVAAIGMTMIIVTGNIDLSFGSMLAVLALTGGNLAKAGVPMPICFTVVVILGAALGTVNGVLVTRFKVPSIIVTLGMMQIQRGAIILVTRGYWVHDLPRNFTALGTGKLLGVELPTIVAAVVLLLAIWFMYANPFARRVYAVGSNREAAVYAGIDVDRTVLAVFAIAGALVGVATMIYATRFITIQSNAGIGFEMTAITAAVVGGTNIMGGSGTILGTFLGALLVGVISNGLTFLKVSAYWEQAIQGILILIAVGAGMVQYARKRKTIVR